MAFEFLKWRPTFRKYERGVRRGDLLFERPRPHFDVSKKIEWGKLLLAYLFGGSIIAMILGAVAFFTAAVIVGDFVGAIGTWVLLFEGVWILFIILQLIHSIRFHKNAKLTDVEFVPLSKAQGLGKRLLTMPEDLPAADWNIFFSRYIWADIEAEPYRDVEEWAALIHSAQSGAQRGMAGGSIAEQIGYAIGSKYAESRLKEIVDMAGGIPSPREIVRIFQTELLPEYREKLGERLAMLYLGFLATQPPVLPYSKSTSRREMRRVASADDTAEVLEYLRPFSEKMEEV